ncbi:hypothetical protein BGZ99_001516 [Dissophora globulifera]|uniref:Uncharacterized protein n=1 Tax=Dissophora globulifera TaxID=979702 RepID=A0A9P6R0Q7_9FUNG|nr:hypothetical protein BGZ99_001516 [Dissophora globulifera]
MADDKTPKKCVTINAPHTSQQPITAVDTSAPPTLHAANADTIAPIEIREANAMSRAGSSMTSSTASGRHSSTSPPRCKKTGTRSTFCPNTLRKGTQLTDADFEDQDSRIPLHRSQAWLNILGYKKTANYGNVLDKPNEPHMQAYY